jgi:hypothetical protein
MIKNTLLLLVSVCLLSIHAQNCKLVLPPNVLTAAGLATPFRLTNIAGDPNSGQCDMAVTATQAFAEASIFDPATGQVTVYFPLVANLGAGVIAPTVPTIPPNAIIGLWFGFNGAILQLADNNNGADLKAANCVNGLMPGDFMGEFAYCNAPAFFNGANNAILAGTLVVPPLGVAKDGLPCPTVRDYAIVDQDQSDNVLASYVIITQNGVPTFAQNTAANRAMAGAKVITNASDNRLVSVAIDTAFGCTPWNVLDLTDPAGNAQTTSLALNELFAANRQPAPQALTPANHIFTLVNGAASLAKVNLYRAGVNQPPIASLNQAPAIPYCQAFMQAAFARFQRNFAILKAFPFAGANLYDFLVTTRFPVSIGPAGNGGLDCVTFGIANPFLNPAAANGNGNAALVAPVNNNNNLIIILASTLGSLVFISIIVSVVIYVRKRNKATTGTSNFIAL